MNFFKRSHKHESHQAPATSTIATRSDTNAEDSNEASPRFAVEPQDRRHSGSDGARAAVASAAGQSAEQCIALIDYDALGEDEISFRAGDVIHVTGKGAASGYWEGYVAIPANPALASPDWSDTDQDGATSSRLLSAVTGGTGTSTATAAASSSTPLPTSESPPSTSSRQQQQHQAPSHTPGLFPNCLVTSNVRFKYPVTSSAFQNVALCLYSYQATGGGDTSFAAGDVFTAVRPSASPGWWYGVKSRGPAWTTPRPPVPAQSAEASTSAPEEGEEGAEEHLFPTNFVTSDVVQVNFNFTGRQGHELSCKPGDIIQVHRRWNDGWWEGSLRGRRGIFPSNYTSPNTCTATPPLFCPRCRTIFPTNLFHATCATCTAEERVEDAMTQAMEAYVRGEAPTYDLFANVDVGVSPAPGSSCTDDDKGSDADVDSGSRTTRILDGQEPAPGSQHSRERHSLTSGAPERARVPLLTEKDLADLASNRVKLME